MEMNAKWFDRKGPHEKNPSQSLYTPDALKNKQTIHGANYFSELLHC